MAQTRPQRQRKTRTARPRARVPATKKPKELLEYEIEAARVDALPDFRVPGPILERVINLLGALPTNTAGPLYVELMTAMWPIEDAPAAPAEDASA